MFLIYLRSLVSEEGSQTRDIFWCNFGIGCAVRLVLRFVGSTKQVTNSADIVPRAVPSIIEEGMTLSSPETKG